MSPNALILEVGKYRVAQQYALMLGRPGMRKGSEDEPEGARAAKPSVQWYVQRLGTASLPI